MANQEHANILKLTLRSGSIKIWEEWRSDNPQIEPDLSEENLKGLFLQGIDFSKTNLSNANLTKVNLRDANLEKTNLSNANLSGANLKTAYLRQVIGLTKEQIKLAINWHEAKYNLELSKELGLPQLVLPVNELSYRDGVTISTDDEIVVATVKLISVKTSINKLGVVIVAAIILGLIITAVNSKAID